MLTFAAIAKKVADAFTAAGCTSVGFWRPTQTVAAHTGAVTPGTAVWSPVRAFVLPTSKGTPKDFDNKLEDDAFKSKELRFVKLVAYDLAITPQAGDQLQFSGKVWRVLGCTPVDPVAGVPLVHGVGVVAL